MIHTDLTAANAEIDRLRQDLQCLQANYQMLVVSVDAAVTKNNELRQTNGKTLDDLDSTIQLLDAEKQAHAQTRQQLDEAKDLLADLDSRIRGWASL